MADPIKRRDFIKTASLFGASIAIADPASAGSFLPGNDDNEIRNDYFTVSFDREKGRFNIYRSNGIPLLTGGTTCVNSSAGKRSVASGNYQHTLGSTTFTDILGSGKKLMIFSKDKEKKSDIEIQLSLYDHSPAITIETICKNVSGQDLVINSLEPVRVLNHEGGALNVPGVSKCITNGEMYYDTGMIHEFGTKNGSISSGDIKGVKLANGPLSSENETIHSWWNAGLFSGYDKEGLAIGYLENNLCLGNLLVSKTSSGQVSFLAESAYAPALILKPGKTISSNRLMINIAGNPYEALENYAGAVGKLNNARTGSILNGWCSWFYTLAQVSENEVVLNTEFAAKHLKQFGLGYIQIDEGFQRCHGDWEGNERFPHGMKWLADKIKSYGFKPGIWISPYVVCEQTEIVQKNPDWLVKRPDGSLQRIGNWPEDSEPPADENPKRYCLDITHPGAAKWLHDLMDTITNDWGYEMIKIDFVAWSVLAAKQFYDPTLSAAQVYRKGMEIMRKAAGDKCHILECGPGAITAGLIDSMRIEADVNYGFSEAAWNTYFLHEACSASAAGKRYYFHQRTWINDADHVCLNLLNNQQSEAAATIIALSGGNMFSGDRLAQLDPYKLEILKKIIPSSGEAAIPVDLFDADRQSVFAVKIKKPFAEWTVAGFFNASLTETVEKKFSLKRLWLEPGRTYLAFDFWKQQFIGEVTDELKVTIQPGTVTLLTLHEKSGKPQFISTDRHVLQGAVEIENLAWSQDTKIFSGISTGPLHTSHNVSVYIPGEHPWTWGGYVLFRDYDSYSLKLVDNNIIRVNLRFEKTERLPWEIKTDEFFK
ncbi:MAG: alpha-galactosidase [Bacteroidota bacterium]|nr:alpha-galactosidase [Bacteroidota bacterium]